VSQNIALNGKGKVAPVFK